MALGRAALDRVFCARIPWVCSSRLPWTLLFTQTFSLCVITSWFFSTMRLFLVWFCAVSLQMPLPGKLGMTVSISGSWPSFPSRGFTCSFLSSYLHAASEGCNSMGCKGAGNLSVLALLHIGQVLHKPASSPWIQHLAAFGLLLHDFMRVCSAALVRIFKLDTLGSTTWPTELCESLLNLALQHAQDRGLSTWGCIFQVWIAVIILQYRRGYSKP